MELLHGFIDLVLHLDHHLVELLSQYGTWIYGILFLIIFSETGLVVTPILPGDSLLFAVGALAAIDSSGTLTATAASLLLAAAAILGNTVNFWLGRWIGEPAFSGRYRLVKVEYLRRTEEYFARYGGATVLVSRFVPIVRTFAPFVAGIGRMPSAQFQAYNFAGGLGWVFLFVWGGYFFGNVPLIKNHFGVVTIVIILVSLVPLIGVLRGAKAALALALLLPAASLSPDARAAATMPAVRLFGYGGPENLRLEQVPKPVAGHDQVLVRVRAASVNPYDWKFREGRLRAFFEPPLPLTPGIDFAGVVEAVGGDVRQWRRGDAVYGFVAEGAEGAYARFVVAAPDNLARKPRALSFEEAAGIPVVALTAWKALYDLGSLRRGERVLLNGASGGFGIAAIQLAGRSGAHVTAVASQEHLALMRHYGADVTLDYRTQNLEDNVRPQVDLAIDAVNAVTAVAALRVVRPQGTLLTLNTFPPQPDCAMKSLTCVQIQNFRPSGTAFAQIAQLVSEGKLRMTVGRTLPLAQAGAAQELSRAGGTPGKIILKVD